MDYRRRSRGQGGKHVNIAASWVNRYCASLREGSNQLKLRARRGLVLSGPCLSLLLSLRPSCDQEKIGLSCPIYFAGLSLCLQVFLCNESPWGSFAFTVKAGWSESDLIWILLPALYLFYFRDDSRLESIMVPWGKLMHCRETLEEVAEEREREKRVGGERK